MKMEKEIIRADLEGISGQAILLKEKYKNNKFYDGEFKDALLRLRADINELVNQV